MGCTLGGQSVVVPNGHRDGEFLAYCGKFALNNKTDPNVDGAATENTPSANTEEEDNGRTTSSLGVRSTSVDTTNEQSEVVIANASAFGGTSLMVANNDHLERHDVTADSSVAMINRSLFPAIVSSSPQGVASLSRTCRSSGGSSGYVTLPAIVNRGSSSPSTKMKNIATRIQSPHVKTIRMHLERQYSDTTADRSLHFPPFHSSKLRKSISCNDSWLSEIDDDDVWDGADDNGHLPAIKEVEVAADDTVAINDGTMSTRTKLPYETLKSPLRSCWSMSSPSSSVPVPKRVRDRSPSMDAARLPVILEDTGTDSNIEEEKEEQRSEDMEEPSLGVMDPQVGRLDVDDDDVNTTEYSVRMYVTSVTELLGLDNIDPRDVPLLNNISIDPSSPLLVQYINPENNGGNPLGGTPTINAKTQQQQQQQLSLEDSYNNNNNNDLKHLVAVNARKQQENISTVIKSVLAENKSDYANVASESDNG